MRILLVSYYHPPAPEVGGVRPARLARFLAECGNEVHVLTLAAAGTDPGAIAAGPGLTIHRVAAWRSPRAMLAAVNPTSERSSEPAAPTAGAGTRSDRGSIWTSLRSVILSAVWFPDDKQGFVGPAVTYGAELVARRSIDLLYVTGPPWSVHLAGLLLHDVTGVPLVTEYRDPWSPTLAIETLNHAWSVRAKRALQRRVLSKASLVVTVTDGIASYVRPFLDAPTPFITALNGLDPAGMAPPRPAPSTGPLRIVHAGEIYYGRDPGPFLQAVAAVVRERGLDQRHLQITFVGNSRFYRGASVEGMAAAVGIGDLVEFVDQMPFAECQQVLRQADALLLLAQHQPLQVPNKLFDYLLARRPILAFVDEGGESDRILRTLRGHAIVTDWGGQEGQASVGAILDRARTTQLDPAEPELLGLRSDTQFRRLVDRLEPLVSMART